MKKPWTQQVNDEWHQKFQRKVQSWLETQNMEEIEGVRYCEVRQGSHAFFIIKKEKTKTHHGQIQVIFDVWSSKEKPFAYLERSSLPHEPTVYGYDTLYQNQWLVLEGDGNEEDNLSWFKLLLKSEHEGVQEILKDMSSEQWERLIKDTGVKAQMTVSKEVWKSFCQLIGAHQEWEDIQKMKGDYLNAWKSEVKFLVPWMLKWVQKNAKKKCFFNDETRSIHWDGQGMVISHASGSWKILQDEEGIKVYNAWDAGMFSPYKQLKDINQALSEDRAQAAFFLNRQDQWMALDESFVEWWIRDLKTAQRFVESKNPEDRLIYPVDIESFEYQRAQSKKKYGNSEVEFLHHYLLVLGNGISYHESRGVLVDPDTLYDDEWVLDRSDHEKDDEWAVPLKNIYGPMRKVPFLNDDWERAVERLALKIKIDKPKVIVSHDPGLEEYQCLLIAAEMEKEASDRKKKQNHEMKEGRKPANKLKKGTL